MAQPSTLDTVDTTDVMNKHLSNDLVYVVYFVHTRISYTRISLYTNTIAIAVKHFSMYVHASNWYGICTFTYCTHQFI